MRIVLTFMCVLALGVMGCSETAGDGGSGGTAGIGGDGGVAGAAGSGGMGGVGGPGGTGGTTGQEFPCTEQGIRDAVTERGGPHTFACDGPQTVVTEAEIVIEVGFSGVGEFILDGGGNLTVDGDDDHPVFDVGPRTTVELIGMTITRGLSGTDGGALKNRGTLRLTGVTVSDSRCTGRACAGGGIANSGVMTLTDSTVSGNISEAFGGGIVGWGTTDIVNSTVSGNELAYPSESGSAVLAAGPTAVIQSTVVGDILCGDSVTIANTLIDGECTVYWVPVSKGYNIESPGDTCGFDPDGTDLVNVSTEDLRLEDLGANGGPTQTHALLPGSEAINKIPAEDCQVETDQRGKSRPESGGTMCDVGAFELEAGLCGGFTTGACEDPSLSCQCCPIGGPAQSCLCSTPCNSDAECTDPSRTTCNRPDFVGSTGFCAPAEFTCCWLCV